MANRAHRRAERKQKPKWEKMTQDQLMKHLTKNGITLQDLENNYQQGLHAGIDGTYQICFAAVCLALNDLHGFGSLRCHRVCERMQHYIINSLTTADAVREVYKRMKLTFDFNNPESWIELEDD
mgnify:CR=1 FL=1